MRNSLSRRIRFAALAETPKPPGRMSLRGRAFRQLRGAAMKGKGLTPCTSSTIVRAMNGHNLICGIIRPEIIR
jgi:hypothetical protein